MVAYGDDDQLVVLGFADEPVFVVDAARLVAAQLSFERFWPADAFERFAHRLLDQPMDAPEHRTVVRPGQVVAPGPFREGQFHAEA